jgi:hypothetical protein
MTTMACNTFALPHGAILGGAVAARWPQVQVSPPSIDAASGV